MKHILVTGGSRGIGAAIVAAFRNRGDEVTFLYEKNHAAAETVCRDTGAKAICCDVADADAVHAVLGGLAPVDVLVNNAGVCHTGLIQTITPSEWQRLFDVNVTGAFYCIRGVLPSMLAAQRGCIVNIASIWGQVGASCEAAYSATKGALIALTKALAQELGPSGIRVNAVAPGVVRTDMLRELSADTLDALAQDTPLGRHAEPREIAETVCYLADAEFVTGQVLSVNGGFVIT